MNYLTFLIFAVLSAVNVRANWFTDWVDKKGHPVTNDDAKEVITILDGAKQMDENVAKQTEKIGKKVYHVISHLYDIVVKKLHDKGKDVLERGMREEDRKNFIQAYNILRDAHDDISKIPVVGEDTIQQVGQRILNGLGRLFSVNQFG